MAKRLDSTSYFRAIVLYGLQSATYKPALAAVLQQLVAADRDRVTMLELAELYLDLYAARLQNGRPQQSIPGRSTVMEQMVVLLHQGEKSRDAIIVRTARQAFNDVIDRFHVVGHADVPTRFYNVIADGLVLTDHALEVFTSPAAASIREEVQSRWDLVESAFVLKREGGQLFNDTRQFYLEQSQVRSSLTNLHPVLHGYQRGRCFYCYEELGVTNHVDHVIPRVAIQHDLVWNLVLAHGFCNMQKLDHLPTPRQMTRLADRNEDLIATNHPLKRYLVHQLGSSERQRHLFQLEQYQAARAVVRHVWSDVSGLEPDEDQFYRAVVKTLTP